MSDNSNDKKLSKIDILKPIDNSGRIKQEDIQNFLKEVKELKNSSLPNHTIIFPSEYLVEGINFIGLPKTEKKLDNNDVKFENCHFPKHDSNEPVTAWNVTREDMGLPNVNDVLGQVQKIRDDASNEKPSNDNSNKPK